MEGLDFGGILGETEVNALFGETEETTTTEENQASEEAVQKDEK